MMSAVKSFAWAGVLACITFSGCGQASRSTGESAPEVMPAAATDPSALMGGELKSDSGGGAGTKAPQ